MYGGKWPFFFLPLRVVAQWMQGIYIKKYCISSSTAHYTIDVVVSALLIHAIDGLRLPQLALRLSPQRRNRSLIKKRGGPVFRPSEPQVIKKSPLLFFTPRFTSSTASSNRRRGDEPPRAREKLYVALLPCPHLPVCSARHAYQSDPFFKKRVPCHKKNTHLLFFAGGHVLGPLSDPSDYFL